MRVFASVVPPQEVLADLVDFLAPRREAGPELRWTPAELWHVTLAFMAQVPSEGVDELLEAVAEASARHTPMELGIAGAGAFPHAADARVTWMGVAGTPAALDSLTALSRAVRSACNRAGAAPAGGPFTPHLTVARSRQPFEATRWLRVLGGYAGPAWTAREVTVFASSRGEGRGSRHYEPIAVVDLGPPD